ncbi:hypothetical protein SLE2022_336750 [Rubroshorea leprosula]
MIDTLFEQVLHVVLNFWRVVNIGATALVTDTATTIFGETGVSLATGVMTVAILLLTEITPKSIAVHNPTEVARFVVAILLLTEITPKSIAVHNPVEVARFV